MRFSPEFIERVRDANNIVDLFAEFTQLKRTGGRLMGLCPFPGHNEKTPSFSVSEDKQVYHCFGCQRSGQIFTALQELKGLSFPEAMEHLASKAGIIMPADPGVSEKDLERKSRREKLLKINRAAKDSYHSEFKNLSSSHYVREYAKKRGLTPEIVDLFQIGYAPAHKDALAQHLQELKAPLDLAESLAIVRRDRAGNGYYDMFRDRLMFPIISHKGECVGFGGRALQSDQLAKYMNSSESEIFQKGQTFYGLNETAKFIRSEGYVIVVEGYMDFLALYTAGIKNVVATLGTAMTPQHAKLIGRYTPHIVVLFDGDEAGQKAAERSLPILLSEELLPKAVFLPDELDPDEYIIERGVDSLRELLQTAPDLFSVILARKLQNYRGAASDKVTLLNDLTPLLENVRDQRLKDLYVTEVAQKIGVEATWITKNQPKIAPNLAPRAENRPTITPSMPNEVIDLGVKIKLNATPRSELFLLNLALMNRGIFDRIWASEVIGELSHPGIQELFLKAQTFYRQMPNEFDKLSAYLMTLAEPTKALGMHLGEPLCSMDDEGREKFLEDCIRQIHGKYSQSKTRELAASLSGSPVDEQQKKLEQIMNIQKSKHHLRRDRES